MHPCADAQLVAQGDDLGDEDLEGVSALQSQDPVGGVGQDVGVAVPVATHPGPEPDRSAVAVEILAYGSQDGLDLVEEVGDGVTDGLAEVVEDRAGLVERLRPDVAEFVGLPYGFDELLDAAVDAAPVGVRPTVLDALLDEVADLGQLVQDGPAGGLGGMGGEHRTEFGASDQLGDLGGGDAGVDQGMDRFVELVGRVRRAAVEVLDAVDLLGDVGQVEVHRERPDQEDGVGDVGVVEEVAEFCADVPVRTQLPEVPGQGSGSFHRLEESLAMLADERVAQLVSETPDVGPQGGVAGLRSAIGGDGSHGGHERNLPEIILLVPST